jgi:transposase-like protein
MQQYDRPAPFQRWVARRKAEIVEAILAGELSLAEACDQYAITTDELVCWRVAYSRHGINGLRAMRAQAYRRPLGQRHGKA